MLDFFVFKLLKCLINWHSVAFFRIAGLTARDDVAFVGLTPANDGNQVFHGQLFRLELLFAVMTSPLPNLLTPPLTLPKLAGFGLLAFLMGFRSRSKKHGPCHSNYSRATEAPL